MFTWPGERLASLTGLGEEDGGDDDTVAFPVTVIQRVLTGGLMKPRSILQPPSSGGGGRTLARPITESVTGRLKRSTVVGLACSVCIIFLQTFQRLFVEMFGEG